MNVQLMSCPNFSALHNSRCIDMPLKSFNSSIKWFGLFYGVSKIAGYLMFNPFYTYIKYKISTPIL